MELNNSQVINIHDDQILNCINLENQDQDLQICFKIYDDVKFVLNFTVLNNLKWHKSLALKVEFLGQHAHVETFLNCLGVDQSQTIIEITGEALAPTNSYFNIQFNGIIDSAQATIKGLPKFNLASNTLDAHHALVIGNLSTHELTYLVSRGIELKTAKYLLITAKLFKCLNGLAIPEQEQYRQKIMKIWGANNA